MSIFNFDGRGGEGRKKALTYLQQQKRERELPEVLKKIEALPYELLSAIRKRAGVPDDMPVKKLTASHRYAMRNAAQDIFIQVDRKAKQAQRAFMLLVQACSANEG